MLQPTSHTSESAPESRKRVVFLDYLRIFACFLVIVVHASENFYGAAGAGEMAGPQSFLANESDRLWVSLYDGFSRMSVPLFIMISAYLLVPVGAGQSMGQFYRRRFKRVVPPFVVFMVLYSTLPVLWGQLDTAAMWRDLSRIPLNFPSLAGHLWFMYPLLSLYLFMPIISPWLERASARGERFFLLLFLLSTCMPYLERWFGELWGQCFWNEYHLLWYFSGYLGYLVLAHYIRFRLAWGRRTRLAAGTAMTLAGAAATIWSFYVQAVPGVIHSTPEIELGWAMCTINCVVLTAGMFLLFSCIRRTKAPALVTALSKLSFGVYLVHIFWLGVWVVLFKGTLALPIWAAIPAIAVATFLSSYATVKLVSCIPGSKWVIG